MSEEESVLVCTEELLSISLDLEIPFEVENDSVETRLSVASFFPRPCLSAISPRVVADEERERSDQLPASEAVLSMLVVAMEALDEHLRMQGENELDVEVEKRLPMADADWDLFILVLLRPTLSWLLGLQ